MIFERGIREVCLEAREMLREKYEVDADITPGEVIGYFDEILAILDEQLDDLR